MLKSIQNLKYPLKVEKFAAQMPVIRDAVGHIVLSPQNMIGDHRYKDDIKLILDIAVEAFNAKMGMDSVGSEIAKDMLANSITSTEELEKDLTKAIDETYKEIEKEKKPISYKKIARRKKKK